MTKEWLDCYQILGIVSSASPREIREAYINKAKSFHSDHLHDYDEQVKRCADEILMDLNESYHVLIDPESRRLYDIEWHERKKTNAKSKPSSSYGTENTHSEDINFIINSLQNASPNIRKEAAETLGSIGDKSAVDPLINIINDNNWQVRASVVDALGNLGDKKAIWALRGLLSDSDPRVRQRVSQALVKLGVKTSKIYGDDEFKGDRKDVRAVNIESLVEDLQDDDWRVRFNAAETLGSIGNSNAVEELIDSLGDDHFRVRASVALALGKLGDTRAVNELIEVLLGREPRQFYGNGPHPIDRGRMPDEDFRVRSHAAEALGLIGDINAVNPLIDVVLYDEDFGVKNKAIESLGILGCSGADFWCNKGYELNDQGRYSEAIECYSIASKAEPSWTSPWFSKGLSLQALGRYEEAMEAYNKVVEMDPSDADAWYNKGLIFAENLHEYNEATNCFNKAIGINPIDADAWHHKGFALAALGNFSEAIRCCDEAIRIKPNDNAYLKGKKDILKKYGKDDSGFSISIGGFKIKWP
jgi:HEAT repeat protein